MAHHDRIVNLPFDAALDVALFERTVFFGHELGGIRVDAENGLPDRNVPAAHEIGIGNHALVLDVRAAVLHVDEIAGSEVLQREVRRLAFVAAANFGSVRDVGPVEACLLLQVPVAVVDFERVDEDAVESGQEVEREFAVDGGAALVEDFHEGFFGAGPGVSFVARLLGLDGLFLVVHDGGEVAFGTGRLCAWAQ